MGRTSGAVSGTAGNNHTNIANMAGIKYCKHGWNFKDIESVFYHK